MWRSQRRIAHSPLLLLAVITLHSLPEICHSLKSSLTYVPQGSSPVLYQPGVDPIMHLDQATFVDTVFEPSRTGAYLVEFYADWCGHCRAFAPHFREFAHSVQHWGEIVQVAAINCADNFNAHVCRANGVVFFPLMKYFPRTSRDFADGIALELGWSASNVKEQLANKVLNEYQRYNYPNWPNLHYLEVTAKTRFEDLWHGTLPSANFLLIVFEQLDNVAVQAILDLYSFRSQIGVRRAPSTSPLVGQLRITKFPYVAMFRRGDQQSIFMDVLKPPVLQDILNQVQPGNIITLSPTTSSPTQAAKTESIIDCEATPERCTPLFYVSEVDLLKGARMTLLDEVTRANEFISGQNFTNLYNYVSLLAEFFPTVTFATAANSSPPPTVSNGVDGDNTSNFNGNELRQRNRRSTATVVLRRSERAKRVFAHLKSVLDQHTDGVISAEEWLQHFENAERVFSHPFPVNASWQHCKGSSPEFRGYTCALWNTFHALTVHAYMARIKTRSLNPMQPLRAIQGWVQSFFGCEHCRSHFLLMTTTTFPMNEQKVRHVPDMIMYLWRAHNIVNNRLHGSVTEDPQFLKFQFPPPFLCPLCHSGGHFSRRQVRNFLLHYYGNIRPVPAHRRRDFHYSTTNAEPSLPHHSQLSPSMAPGRP